LSVDRLSAFAAVTVCVSTVLVMSAMRSPYRQTAPLGVSARPVSVRGHSLEIEKTAADYLETVRSLSGAAGFRQDTPMLDFTGRSPGVLYAIGARSIGQGWMIGGYPGSNELTTRALTAVECGELVQAWLITEPGGGRRLSEAQILASFGIRFPEDYEEVAEWIVPAGKGWKAFEGRQKLFRPRRDSAEARVDCEAHRHLNRTS